MDEEASVLGGIEPAVHVPARLEGRDHLFGDRDFGAIARVSPGACVAHLDREDSEAAQLDPVTTRERSRDRVQDGVDNGLNVPRVEVRVLLRNKS